MNRHAQHVGELSLVILEGNQSQTRDSEMLRSIVMHARQYRLKRCRYYPFLHVAPAVAAERQGRPCGSSTVTTTGASAFRCMRYRTTASAHIQ